jgi:nucleoside-diphosphate-sugar epimerase
MRILLTGANGFIGRHVVKELTRFGIDVITVGSGLHAASSGHLTLDLLAKPDLGPILCSLKPTHLIHLAWYTEHGKYWDSEVNLGWMVGTYHLLESFFKSGGEHAFLAGTCAEYDWRYGYCDEELTPCNPSTLYGIAKDTTRRMCQMLRKTYGTQMAWGRVFFPYGPGEGERRLIPSLFRAFRKEIPPFGVNGNFIRDFIHVSDLAKAICQISMQRIDGVVNLCSGTPVSLNEIVEIVADLCNSDCRLILDLKSPKRDEPDVLIGNTQKLISTGWRKGPPIRSALKGAYQHAIEPSRVIQTRV